VTYIFTALSEEGNKFIDGFSEAYFSDYIDSWGVALNRFLAKNIPQD